MIPVFPTDLFPRPFADNGTWQKIPDTKATAGRASFREGFPLETQQPLTGGGVAPNRTDFNGILHMLTAFAFWQQSGGLWNYKNTLNYLPPCMVHHNGKLWWCAAGNGPDTTVTAPGSNDAVWRELLGVLAEQAGKGGSLFGNPVGTVIMYYGTAAPDGYLPCNGASFSSTSYPQLYALLGKATTPDMRGLFARGYDTRKSVDPDGASRAVGSIQTDAGRNVTGAFNGDTLRDSDSKGVAVSGVFGVNGSTSYPSVGQRGDHHQEGFNIDASRVWGAAHTAAEFRPVNMCLLYCIKHD
jgi:hypothetical protein